MPVSESGRSGTSQLFPLAFGLDLPCSIENPLLYLTRQVPQLSIVPRVLTVDLQNLFDIFGIDIHDSTQKFQHRQKASDW